MALQKRPGPLQDMDRQSSFSGGWSDHRSDPRSDRPPEAKGGDPDTDLNKNYMTFFSKSISKLVGLPSLHGSRGVEGRVPTY